jgi:hypothetical protein
MKATAYIAIAFHLIGRVSAMSTFFKYEPDGNKPQETSWLEGCVGGFVCLLIFIIGGVCYWNHWKAGIEREAKYKVDRWLESVREAQESAGREQLRIWAEEQKRKADEWRLLIEQLEKYKNRRGR